MNKRISWLYLLAVGLLAAAALPPPGAAEVLLDVVDWIGDSRIAEFAVAANAFAIVP